MSKGGVFRVTMSPRDLNKKLADLEDAGLLAFRDVRLLPSPGHRVSVLMSLFIGASLLRSPTAGTARICDGVDYCTPQSPFIPSPSL